MVFELRSRSGAKVTRVVVLGGGARLKLPENPKSPLRHEISSRVEFSIFTPLQK